MTHQRAGDLACSRGFVARTPKGLSGHIGGSRSKAIGTANARWNDGCMHTSHGYIAIKVPEGHHLRQAHGYAYEHDLVAERLLGRRLLRNEVVHHLNGVRDDNRPENIEVTTRSEHAREHASHPDARDRYGRFKIGVRHGDWSEWPSDLQVREFPEVRRG